MITKKDKVIRDERSQDWEVENLSESTLILHSPNIFSSSRLKGSKIIFSFLCYPERKKGCQFSSVSLDWKMRHFSANDFGFNLMLDKRKLWSRQMICSADLTFFCHAWGIFSCPGQLNRWHCQSVSEWGHFWFQRQSRAEQSRAEQSRALQ